MDQLQLNPQPISFLFSSHSDPRSEEKGSEIFQRDDDWDWMWIVVQCMDNSPYTGSGESFLSFHHRRRGRDEDDVVGIPNRTWHYTVWHLLGA